MRLKFILPVALFGVLIAFLAIGLSKNPREIPSALIDKKAPSFTLPRLFREDERISLPQELAGKTWILNVWASWCAACKDEHPVLLELARTSDIPLVGLNYKDSRQAAMQWLADHANPYALVAVDRTGDVGIDYGVYGVPETYVIDGGGHIRYKHTGPLRRQDIAEMLRASAEDG